MNISFINLNFLFDKLKIKNLIQERTKGYVCVVNANIVVNANKDEDYRKIINNSLFNICDGSIIALLYNKIYNKSISSYPGPDMFIEYIKKKQFTSAFIGSSDELLSSLKKEMIDIDSSIEHSLFYSPPFFPNVEDFNFQEIANLINQKNPDIIWIALGAPKQEKFMSLLLPYIDEGIMIGVGAAFTFYSGQKNFTRAPLWMRNAKLEWLFRIYLEPKKTLTRLFSEIVYLPFLIFKEIRNK